MSQQTDEIARRYQNGETMRMIAKSLRLSDNTVTKVLRIRGIPRRPLYGSPAESEARFWAKVDRGAADTCWLFTGFRDRDGYGRTRVTGMRATASRAAFFYTHGYWPTVARHSCDNPPCCNPAHIIDGTHDENMRDRDSRGRVAHGEHAGKAKLTLDDVLEIRTLVGLCRVTDLARSFGVSTHTITAIKRGVSWRRIDG